MNPAPATLKFDIGVPQVLSIAYAEGKPVTSRFSGDQLMFTTTQGDRFYVDPYVQERMRAAGVQPNVPFEIEKVETRQGNRRAVEFKVRRLAQPAPHAPAAPVSVSAPAAQPTPGPVNGAGETSSAIMARCYHQAIDIALGAVQYAESRGLRVTPDFEDIRAMAATLVINETGGRR